MKIGKYIRAKLSLGDSQSLGTRDDNGWLVGAISTIGFARFARSVTVVLIVASVGLVVGLPLLALGIGFLEDILVSREGGLGASSDRGETGAPTDRSRDGSGRSPDGRSRASSGSTASGSSRGGATLNGSNTGRAVISNARIKGLNIVKTMISYSNG